MKLTTIALALAFTLPATLALAQALPGTEASMSLPRTEFAGSPTGVMAGQTGRIATRPMNVSGNTLGAIADDPSGSTLTPSALSRGR
jgi:hypothetical protein